MSTNNSRGFQLTDFTSAGLIEESVYATNKSKALERLVALLISEGRIDDGAPLLNEILERERLMSTGIGKGVAVPHVHSDRVKSYALVIGRCPEGIDYDAVDGEPVRYIFLVACPRKTSESHLHIVSRLSRILAGTDLLNRLDQCTTAEDILEAFREVETSA